jgi:hypothetical protein
MVVVMTELADVAATTSSLTSCMSRLATRPIRQMLSPQAHSTAPRRSLLDHEKTWASHAGCSDGILTPVDITLSRSHLSAFPKAHLIPLTFPNCFIEKGVLASFVWVLNWNGKCFSERAVGRCPCSVGLWPLIWAPGMAEEHETCIERR